jgi:hypothetical protein
VESTQLLFATLRSILLAGFVAVPHVGAQETTCRSEKTSQGPWGVAKAWKWYEGIGPLRGCNYLPRTAVNATEMWQSETFDPKTIDQELGWAEESGYNSLRVFLQYVVWRHDPAGLKKRMGTFLDLAARHRLTVTFVLFDDCAFSGREPYLGKQDEPVPGVHNSQWVPSPGHERVTDKSAWPELRMYVKDVLQAFRSDQRVLMWDLYNEPGNGGMGEKSLPLVEAVFAWAREANPRQPLTVGAWGTDSKPIGDLVGQRSIRLSDVITFHCYEPPEGMQASIEFCRKTERPVICTEWLRRQVGCTFAAILPIFAKNRIGWYNWGLVAGRTQTFMWWGSKKGDPVPGIWQDDMLKSDGSPYDPAELELIRTYCTAMVHKKPVAAQECR